MSVKSIRPNIDTNNNVNRNNKMVRVSPSTPQLQSQSAKNISFKGGFNPFVTTMDFIEAGGYAAAFIIQDGLGFIAPRVGKGLLRGGKKVKDENGNDVLDKNGNPKHHLNWVLARKEFIREIITGPSAFLIPLGMLSVISKHFGSGNRVKMNYLSSFEKPFNDFALNNVDKIKAGEAADVKASFYEKVFNHVIEESVNSKLSNAEKMSAQEIADISKEFASRQVRIEEIMADKTISKKARKAKVAELGSIEDSFMQLKKSKIGGAINELAVQFKTADGKVKGGNIGELLSAMKNYFSDASNHVKNVVKEGFTPESLAESMKHFTGKRMGTRLLTNFGIFGAVAAFYTQIPKLYNAGTHGNPALNSDDAPQVGTKDVGKVKDSVDGKNQKQPSFTGGASILEKAGNGVFGSKKLKGISDIFELNGPVISGNAMSVLLYGFCIPPRLKNAQDKYDYGEIIVRDMTAFTTLLFGAKALARLCSDGFTKLTGLALNQKTLEGRNKFQRIIDYLNPADTHHSVLSSKQLNSKYMNLETYKNGVEGFMEFIEKSGGNVKKALSQDGAVKDVVDNIVKDFNGKSFAEATSEEIKSALTKANNEKTKLIDDFYKLFKNENKLLKRAKTCNSAFGFFSTLVFVPVLIERLTTICERMTERRQKADKELAEKQNAASNPQAKVVSNFKVSNTPTMAGFLAK
jgi:hypothetical protein